MSRLGGRSLYAQKRREHGPQGERFSPIRIDLCREPRTAGGEPELLESYGGLWDRRRKDYVDEADEACRFTLHEGQMDVARWFVEWTRAYARGERLEVDVVTGNDNRVERRVVRSMTMAGGRRGGKTNAAVKFAACFAVMRPRSRVWLVSEDFPKTEELELDLLGLLPSTWYVHLGAPWYKFTLVNGSIIWLRSAHDPEKLKRGRCDFAVFNEAQNIAKRAYVNVRGALSDKGGLCVLAANPPDQPIGQWVDEHVEETVAKRRAAVYFFIDPRKNPHIDYGGLEDLRSEVDDRTYAIEVLGEFRPRTDVVFHAWSPRFNVRPVPTDAEEVTDEFLRKHFGRPFGAFVGADFQLTPHQAGVVGRIWSKDAVEDRRLRMFEKAGIYYVDEAVVEQGDENDLIDALEGKGLRGDDTAVIADASGEWQDAERTRGRGSFDIFRRRGWKWIYPPDPSSKRNPHVTERVKVANARMKTADGERHLFSAPENLHLNRALRLWENKNGIPFRRSEHAHLCDAATYPLWRFYPRKVPRGRIEYRGLGTSRRREDFADL
jgi:hypothetical protein